MRHESTIAVSIILSVASACGNRPAMAAPQPNQASPAAAPRDDAAIIGRIAEILEVSQYSYLRIQSDAGEVWAAVPKTKKAVGDRVTVLGPIWMDDFKSKSMNRTWEHIAFGTLESDGSAAASDAQQMPPNHPPIQQPDKAAGMFAAQAAKKPEAAQAMPAHGPKTGAADLGVISVAKAPGAQGHTVAEIRARKAQLKDREVTVRGKVVKSTNGVMGKNWLHVRDGSGQGSSADLAVVTADTASVGDTVLVSGIVRLDRDLGAGYFYDVLVDDAQVRTE